MMLELAFPQAFDDLQCGGPGLLELHMDPEAIEHEHDLAFHGRGSTTGGAPATSMK